MLNHNLVFLMPQNELAREQDLRGKISNKINRLTLSIPYQEQISSLFWTDFGQNFKLQVKKELSFPCIPIFENL